MFKVARNPPRYFCFHGYSSDHPGTAFAHRTLASVAVPLPCDIAPKASREDYSPYTGSQAAGSLAVQDVDPSRPIVNLPFMDLPTLADLNIDKTIGVIFLAVSLSSIMYGATCTQIFSYFNSARSKQDSQILRFGVLALWLVDTFQQVLIFHVGYHYLVIDFGDRSGPLTSLPWSVPTEILLLAISALLFNSFLTARLWLLSRNVMLSALAAFLTIITAGTSMSFAIRGYGFDSLMSGLLHGKPHGIAALCLDIVTECMLSASIACHLYKARSGMQKHDNFLTKVIILTVTTGMLTTPFNVATLVTYVVPTKSLTVLLLNFLLAKLYACSFITTLNIRQYLLNLAVKVHEPESLAMSNLIFNAIPPSTVSTSTCDVPQPVAEPIARATTPSLIPPDAIHV